MALTHLETLDMDGYVATIKRTSRQGSVGFRLSSGKVVILAPKDISASQISLILESKRHLILDKLEAQDRVTSQTPVMSQVERRYLCGERFAYLGGELVIKVNKGRPGACFVDAKKINVNVLNTKPDLVRNALVLWYKQQAQKHIEQRISYFAPIVGAWPKAIEIKTYKARWGSCTSKGLVQFNWKIMMAPPTVVDSVVVHELCHLLHMNHGPEFWGQVMRVCPAYQDAKQWLKNEGRNLGLD